jgi:signal transduction histidine kinase
MASRDRSGGRRVPLTVMILAITLLIVSIALGSQQRERARAALDQRLKTTVAEETAILDNYFERARSIALITSNNPAFAGFYEAPGSRLAKIQSGNHTIIEASDALGYLQQLFPTSIGEACFIDVTGPENARVVRGEYATLDQLAPDESANPFFGPTFELQAGQVYQAKPYVSPDTGEWVISNSTLVPTDDGSKLAIVHFEVTLESFRETAATLGGDHAIQVVDAGTGTVVIDSQYEQTVGAPLGPPSDDRFGWLSGGAQSLGLRNVGDTRVAFRRLAPSLGNANRWFVVASAPTISFLGSVGLVPISLIPVAIVLLILGGVNFGRVTRTIQRQNDRLREQGERLEQAQFERGRLLAQAVDAGEVERRRIAAELHDGPIQDLTALDLKLEPLRLDLEGGERASSISVEDVQKKIRDEIGELRNLIVRLRPPALDERGLEAALSDQARLITRESHVECRVDSELDGRLNPTVETIMYRVAQEALANVVKHAKARRADVSLRSINGAAVLEVRDDGVGFDMSKQGELLRTGHFGLAGMRERVEMAGGVWRIESHLGNGTRILAEVPK